MKSECIFMREMSTVDDMKDRYDFSKGVRGKFFVAEDEIRLPRYLEPGLERKLKHIAETAVMGQSTATSSP